MSRAQEFALERLPKSDDIVKESRNRIHRQCFISGYEKALDDVKKEVEKINEAISSAITTDKTTDTFHSGISSACNAILSFIDQQSK